MGVEQRPGRGLGNSRHKHLCEQIQKCPPQGSPGPVLQRTSTLTTGRRRISSAPGVLEQPQWQRTSQDQRWLRPPSRQCALQELPALPPPLTTSQDTAVTMDASLPKSCRSRVPLLPQPLCQSGSHFVRALLLLPSTPTKRLQVQVAAPALPPQHRLRAPPLSRPRRPRLLSQRSPASRF